MSETILGDLWGGVKKGALSPPFEPTASGSQETLALRGSEFWKVSSTALDRYHPTKGDIFGEKPQCTADQKFSVILEYWVQSALISGDSLRRENRSPEAGVSGKRVFLTWGSDKDSREDWRFGSHAGVSQSFDRRFWSSVFLAGSPALRERVTGPVQFMRNLLETWKLRRDDAVPLLGFEQSDRMYVRALMDGRTALAGRDVKDRIAYLVHMRMTLSALFRDEEVENQWLREQQRILNNETPIGLLLDGGMEKLLLVKEYVDLITGR